MREDKKSAPLKRTKIKPISDKLRKKRAEERKLRGGEPTELQKWYNRIMKYETPVCEETGEPISKNDFGWHGSIAHILPKEHFPSVKTHPLNYLILKMWGGVHDKSHNWESFRKMKVWPKALERIEMMWPELSKSERAKLPPFIVDHIENREPF